MLNNKILISVIIPYFKKKKFIFKTINSVLNQSYKNLEVIIIYDDKDLSDLKFIKSFSKKDKRIKYFSSQFIPRWRPWVIIGRCPKTTLHAFFLRGRIFHKEQRFTNS